MPSRLLLVPSLVVLSGIIAAEDAVVPAPAPAAETLTVESQADTAGSTGTKSATTPLLQPQSFGVVDEALMRQQHVLKLEDVIGNVGGVTIGGYYSDWDYYRIRGFDAASSTRHDGLFTAPGIWISPDVFGAERVEVLKGPSSMLYGRSSLGGMVNIISKKPKVDDFATVTASAGSYDFAELTADAGMAFADDQLGVRLVALGRNRGHWVDGVDDSQRLYVAPSFTWWAGDNTTITVLSYIQKDDTNAAWPLPASGFITSNPNGKLPIDLNVGEPGYQNHIDNSRVAIGYELSHRFSENVALRQTVRVTDVDEDFTGIYLDNLLPDGRTLERSAYKGESDYLLAQADTGLDVRFHTGAVRHDALVGVDVFYDSVDQTGRDGEITPLDLFDPVYGARPVFSDPYRSKITTMSIGVYVQDQVTIAERLSITAGFRWDTVDAKEKDMVGGGVTRNDDDGLTWRVGAAYEFHPTASVFASYSTAFTPQPYYFDADGDQVDPETGNQIEVGVRTIDPHKRYSAMLAFYQITRTDVATPDPNDPLVSRVTGEQRSRGLDLDAMLKPIPELSFTGSYAYIDAEITKDTDFPTGDRLINVPEHSTTAWVTYTLQDTVLRGLGLGLGVRWYSSQAGDMPNTFDLPAYAVMDAGLFYDRGPLSAQINVDNLLDEEYAVGSYSDLYVLPGDPLTVRGSVSWTF
jgi:iron complex outermembrane receptor protein